MSDNYGNGNGYGYFSNGDGNGNGYGNNGRENLEDITIDKVDALIDAIQKYPLDDATEEDKRRVLDLIDPYISSGAEDPYNPGLYMYDIYITTSQPINRDVEEEEDGNANTNENNENFNKNYNIDKEHRHKVRRGGLSPHVYAYLTQKYDIFDILTKHIINKEYVFNKVDLYEYKIADYALENKDFESYYNIRKNRGELYHYTDTGAKVPGEEGNTDRNNANMRKAHMRYTDENYRKMIKKYANTHNKGKPIAGFHGNVIQLPRASVAPARSRKHITTNEPVYGRKTFRSQRYGPKKDLLIPVESKSIADWIQAQTDYINSTERIKYHVTSYTKHGDELVNMYLRKTLFDKSGKLNTRAQSLFRKFVEYSQPIPFIYQIVDNYERIIKMYKQLVARKKIRTYGIEFPPRSEIERDGVPIDHVIRGLLYTYKDLFKNKDVIQELMKLYAYELNRIIEKSPRLPDSVTVYRGVSREFELPKGMIEYTTNSFLSTSLDPRAGIRFAQELYPTLFCCVYEIRIPKTLPVLYTEPVSKFKKEYEILLPIQVRMKGSDKMLLKRLYGYEDRVLVREMTAKGIHVGKPMSTLRTTRIGDRRVTHRMKSMTKSKRSVRKSRKASVVPEQPRKPLGGAGGPSYKP